MEDRIEILEPEIDESIMRGLNEIGYKLSKKMSTEKPPRSAEAILEKINLINQNYKQINTSPDSDWLQKDLIPIELMLHYDDYYSDYAELLQVSSQNSLILFKDLVVQEISHFEKIHTLLRETDVKYYNDLKDFVNELDQIIAGDDQSFTLYYQIREKKNQITQAFLESAQTINTEEEHFFKKRIEPYYYYLVENQNTVSEATRDLEIIVKGLLKNIKDSSLLSNLNMIRVNHLDEIEVTIDNKTYNLTTILKHEPNFSQINLTERELDDYLDYILTNLNQQSSVKRAVFLPTDKFPVPLIKRKLDSKTLMHELSNELAQRGEENIFENCHASEVLGIHEQTGTSYIVVGKLAREGTLKTDLFTKGCEDKTGQQSLDEIELRLTGSSNRDEMDADQRNQLIFESILLLVVATKGLTHCKHLRYSQTDVVSMQDNLLNTQQGRMVRATSGKWVEEEKRRIDLAKASGIPLYYRLTSTSFDTTKAKEFISDPNTPLVTKSHPWSGIPELSPGAFIKSISNFPAELEYMFPPCLSLVDQGAALSQLRWREKKTLAP